MKLYKFRSLEKMEFVLDIVLNERLYCSHYHDLNDPFEGLFDTIFLDTWLFGRWPLPGIPVKRKKVIKSEQSVEGLLAGSEELRVCSLSKNMHDVRMWSHYASGHTGVAIEIDFNDFEADVRKVDYDNKLPTYGSGSLVSPNPQDVLSIKTNHWEYESEYRVLQKDQYYSIPGRVAGIYAGFRASDLHIELLVKALGGSTPIHRTMLDRDEIKIVPKK